MKCIIFIFILVLLQVSFAFSQIPDQPFQYLFVGRSINQITYSPDGNFLAVACGEGLYLCDTRTWNEPRLLIKGRIMSVAFSPDGRTLAAGAGWEAGENDDWRENWQEIIYLWDLQNEKQTKLIRRADFVQSVLSVCFSPDSQTLVSGDGEGIWFWNVERGENVNRLSFGDFTDVYSLAYRHDGNMLAVGTYNYIFLVDPKRQEILSTLRHQNEMWPELWILCIAFSPDGTILASGSGDNVVNLWDVSSSIRIGNLRHNGDVRFVCFTPSGKQVVYGGWGMIVRVYDILAKETIFWEGAYTIKSGALSPDGKTLAVAGLDRIISFWEMPQTATNVRSLNKKPVLWGMLKSR